MKRDLRFIHTYIQHICICIEYYKSYHILFVISKYNEIQIINNVNGIYI